MKKMNHKIYTRRPLGNPHRVWRQDNFILSTFAARGDNMRDALENCKAAGFNTVELGWASHKQAEEALRLCEELRLDLIFQDFSKFGGMQVGHLDHKLNVDEVKAVVDHIRPYRCCIGYYNWDEPYVLDQLEEARRQEDMFQSADPDRLQFIVAIPSYNDKYRWENGEFAPYLNRYAEIVDPAVLSLDYYPYGLPGYKDETQMDNSLMWCDLGLMRKVGREHKMPLWFYYQAVNLHRYAHFEFPMVRMSMYAAAMYGCKGLQQFTAVGSVITAKGTKAKFFDETKAIHGEFEHLGNTLMALENRYVFHSDDLLPGSPYMEGLADDIAESEILAGALEKRVSVGELADAYGENYLLVLNRELEEDRILHLNFKKPVRIYEVSKETGRQTVIAENVQSCAMPFVRGDGRLFRVQDAEKEAFTVEYRLEK